MCSVVLTHPALRQVAGTGSQPQYVPREEAPRWLRARAKEVDRQGRIWGLFIHKIYDFGPVVELTYSVAGWISRWSSE